MSELLILVGLIGLASSADSPRSAGFALAVIVLGVVLRIAEVRR